LRTSGSGAPASDGDLTIRAAIASDADAIAALVNDAYSVESFFVGGNRVSAADVFALIRSNHCLVAASGGDVAACIEVSVSGRSGYFGMLAVAPRHQGRGLGRRMIAAAETRARNAGCTLMRITVVNLRTELFPFYERLGYVAVGTKPYTHRPVIQPCHFVVMEKSLTGS
jgi:GNAT superfamily N-acetyltransferase